MKIYEISKLIADAGGVFRGIQKGIAGKDFAMFDEPSTKSTMMIRLDSLTLEAVRQKLVQTKAKFAGHNFRYDYTRAFDVRHSKRMGFVTRIMN